jgi:hypothetical protein
MGCEYFGGVDLGQDGAGEIVRGWTDSCIADNKHPRARLVRDRILALYCCDKATDVPGLTAARELGPADQSIALTFPGQALLELLEQPSAKGIALGGDGFELRLRRRRRRK